ncbi:DNA repair protein [Jannaschia formosa]|uniref:DNA repair protein n=1 Tax=Jannaschia formosa TaxID=2259592 RepID=UPI000E1BAF8B|nr:DNA repair protein [Jannaschia formosa]TFL18564.1 DNA repair protein [Jannaschia formosa]
MNSAQRPVSVLTYIVQSICAFILVAAAIAVVAASIAAAFGIIPWLELPVAYGGAEVADAGMIAQLAFATLLLAIVGFLPALARVRRLEVTNRDFQLSMADVAQAYQYVHQADREGVFSLSREFDTMRERIEWMRKHPDLGELEYDVLQTAAQMSVESRELAEVYSDEKVERARSFLRERQHEVEDYRQRISMAQATVGEIKRWMQAVSVEEGLAEKQIERLKQDLTEVTDALKLTGYDRPENVVGMRRREGSGGDKMATPAE